MAGGAAGRKLTGEEIAAIEGVIAEIENGKTYREIGVDLGFAASTAPNRLAGFFSVLRGVGVEVNRPLARVCAAELAEFRAWKASREAAP